MSAVAHASPDTPSGRRVLALGLLMTGSFWIQFVEALPVSLDLTWFLPVLAGWLAARHGVGVLRAWWPLALLPALGLTLDAGIGLRFGVSSATLLLSLAVAAAVDQRFSMPPPGAGCAATRPFRRSPGSACWFSPRSTSRHGG